MEVGFVGGVLVGLVDFGYVYNSEVIVDYYL